MNEAISVPFNCAFWHAQGQITVHLGLCLRNPSNFTNGKDLYMLFENCDVLRNPAFKIWNWRSQYPRGLSRESAAVRLLGFWVWIPPEAWMSVTCDCCVLSGRGLCDKPITRPGESYRLWCIVVCDLQGCW